MLCHYYKCGVNSEVLVFIRCRFYNSRFDTAELLQYEENENSTIFPLATVSHLLILDVIVDQFLRSCTMEK